MKQLNKQEKQQLVVYDTRKEQPSIWNLQAFVIVFLFIMLATTINVYSVNNDNLTWVDSNGDFKLDSYNHSMINLDTDLIELNNNSLNDVFLDGNIITNLSYSNVQVVNVSIVDDVYYYDAYGGPSEHYLTYNLDTQNINPSDKLYFNLSLDDLNGRFLGIAWQYTIYSSYVSFKFVDTTSSLGYKSSINVVDNNYNSSSDFLVRYQICSTTSCYFTTLNEYVKYSNPHIINLTDLGLDNLTKVKMDYYYNLYKSLQENRIEAYKDLGNEPISQWQNLTQTVSSLIDDILQPVNDVNDWINKFMNGLFS